jgi:DNA-binding NtrC family response regulator
MNNTLVLLRDGVSVREIALGTETIEVGSDPDADVRIDDPSVPARALLVQPRAGTVWMHLLAEPDGPRIMPIESPVLMGTRHAVVRRSQRAARRTLAPEARTTPLDLEQAPIARWTVAIGRGSELRRFNVGDTPVTIGTARDNDIVLLDPTVSAHHCRLDPEGSALTVRDLGSTNGIYVRGLRVRVARLDTLAQLRIGRTTLTIVAGVRDADSSSFVVASDVMHAVVAQVKVAASLSWPVLLSGPSGSGKEELACALHRDSTRSKGPFVALNAGGLPRELIESELFGHERGAFTGALAQRRGVFEQAQGGTLFLDEIGELPLDLQTRLLRVLETWQVRRVGAERAIDVDVRVVCATHRNLLRMVAEGTFRQDLYFRLAQLVIRVPRLAERTDDIDALATHFLVALAPEVGLRKLSAEGRAVLLAHHWPGNVRELRNVLRSACAAGAGVWLEAADIRDAIARISGYSASANLDNVDIEKAVRLHRGNLAAASRALDIPRSTLRDRLKRSRSSEQTR